MPDEPKAPDEEPRVVTLDLVVHGAEEREPLAEREDMPPAEGVDQGSVERAGLPRLPKGCPVVPLGKKGDIYFYIDDAGQLQSLKARDHTRMNIAALFDNNRDWLYQHYARYTEKGEVRGIEEHKLAYALTEAAGSRGLRDWSKRIRGVGAWLGPDSVLVLHCGNAVIFAGEDHNPGLVGEHIYPAEDARPRPALKAAEPGEHGPARQLLSILEMWNWSRGKIDARLMLGWIVAAMAGGALHWRPIMALAGESGTGKTTLQDYVEHVFDGGLLRTSNATAAGIHQAVGNSSLPVLVDEAEKKDDNRQMQAVIELARQAASGGLVLRGGADHIGVQFSVRSCFLFSAITTPPLLPQDRSRIAALDLDPLNLNDPPPVTPEQLAEIGAGLRRRLVDHWRRLYSELLATWRNAMKDLGHDARGSDLYGTLLACADLALVDDGPTSDCLEQDLDLREHLSADVLAERYDVASEHERCLNHLLSTLLFDAPRGGRSRLVTEWIEDATRYQLREKSGEALIELGLEPDKGNTGKEDAQDVLARHGLRVESFDESLWLAIANNHEGLRRLFENTKWHSPAGATGGWVQLLKRIDGAVSHGAIRFMRRPSRCVLVPLAKVWKDPDKKAG